MVADALVSARGRIATSALAALLALALAFAPGARAGAIAGATRVGSAPPAQQLELVFPLVADYRGLQRFATAVTTIGSPEYGQFESIAQLAARFGASARTRARVVAFLRASGASGVRVGATGLLVEATLSAGTAERLFATSLSSFGEAHGARFTAPSSSVSLPAGLQGLVTGVVGLDTRPLAQSPPFTRGSRLARAAQGSAQAPSGYVCSSSTPCLGTPSGCAAASATGGFTPNEYLTAYGYDSPPITGSVLGQRERVALIEIDGFKGGDITAFAKCFGLRVPAINAFDANGNLGAALPAGGESTLDLEVLDAVAPGLSGIDVYESHADAADTLQALAAPLDNPGYKPQVISASLGLCERNTYEAVGKSGVEATEAVLEEATATGISFVAAAGDAGSADCTDNGTPVGPLAVNYPASSPWVTAVGGTNFALNAANQITSQVVWNDTTVDPGAAGGGGFSDLFNPPGYQDVIPTAVAAKSRALPDVAMLADIAPGYAIYCTAPGASECGGAGWQTVGGTSAGTPLLAGGFALVDQLLRNAGKQDLGLANPLLYKIGTTPALGATSAGQVFYDVTQASNDVGAYVRNIGGALGCCTAGPGYDEASGWGSVNLAAFATDALSLSPAVVDISMSLPGGQRPIEAKRVVAKVSCTGACLVGAYASVYFGSKPAFTQYSNLYTLAGAGSKSVAIGFSGKQLKALRTALARHQRVTGFIRAAIVDAGGNVEKQTASLKLTIRS